MTIVKMLLLRIANMALLIVALSCLWIACASSSQVILRDNGYDGVVVALDDQIPASKCQEVVRGLEDLVRASSSVLFVATRGRASFRSIKVLVPSAWSALSCPALGDLQDALGETWEKSDLRVTLGKHPDYGSKPWTLHSRGCGQVGDYISMGHDLLMMGNDTLKNDRLLAFEWLKYRYGVFEEIGVEKSVLHPTHFRASDGSWTPNACANIPLDADPSCHSRDLSCSSKVQLEDKAELTKSFMAFPEVPTVKELCDEGTHNSEAPTRHNLLCNGKSSWEVLRASPDFQNNRNVEGGLTESEVTFQYVQSHSPRIVLLIDDSSIMNVQNRWDFMRKAVRKFISYDIPDDYRVGLVVFNSFASTRYQLTILNDGTSREKVGSALPRYPSMEDEHRRCIICGVREALKLINKDGVGGHIIMVTGGGGSVGEEEVSDTVNLLSDAHVTLHVIIYPLAEEKSSPDSGLEILAARSSGDTFIVRDDGVGDVSKLSMYYNLLDSFYSTLLAASSKSVLPVKIHSAEHAGGGSRMSQGSFMMDPTLGKDTVFAIFYYNLIHVGNQVHLINPHGQVIDTANMQKEDNNIHMITVPLVEAQVTPGLWHYKVENRASPHQALYVQVTSRPRLLSKVPSVNIRTWTSHSLGVVNVTDISRPLAIYAEVRAGLMGISEANVTASLQRFGYTMTGLLYPPLEISLYDNGFTGPDMLHGDGVYSRYVPKLASAKYSVTVHVKGKIDGRDFMRQSRLGIIDVIGLSPVKDTLPPSRVVDLQASLLLDTINQVSFTWTAPGGDFDFGTATGYIAKVSTDQRILKEGGGDLVEDWPSPLPSLSVHQHTITWEDYETVSYFAILAVDEYGNAGALSNIVSVYVPKPPTTTLPPPLLEPTVYPFNTNAVRDGNTAPVLASLDTNKLAVIFGCIGGFIVVATAIICFCAVTHYRRGKTEPAKSTQDVQNSFTINVASKGIEFPEGKNALSDGLRKEYISSVESWSASQLLNTQQEGSMSGRSDDNSDHSSSTKKSFGGSSGTPDVLMEGAQYHYKHPSYPYHYPVPSDGYPTPTEGYPSDSYPPPSESRSYISSQPSDSFLSVSCDILPSSHGPPAYPAFEASHRSPKVPPPIPPKPKVLYTPEPYMYDSHSLDPHSSTPSVTSEKRVRNVTMV